MTKIEMLSSPINFHYTWLLYVFILVPRNQLRSLNHLLIDVLVDWSIDRKSIGTSKVLCLLLPPMLILYTQTSIKAVQCKSVFYSNRPTYTGNMTPDPEAVTPEGVTSSSSGTDATFSFDEDDEEDCYSSASSSSSSLPSPEIFRRENCGMCVFVHFYWYHSQICKFIPF